MKTKHRYGSHELCARLYHPRAAGSTWSRAGAGGGRGGGEKGGDLRKQQPYQCWNGSAVGDVGLPDWEKRNYSSFHPTLMGEGFFFLLASSCSFKTSRKSGRDLSPNIKESMRKSIWSDAFCSMELPSLQAQTRI